MWENLRVIVISSMMTVLILAAAIWMGIIPTTQQIEPDTYQLKQIIDIPFNYSIDGGMVIPRYSQSFSYPLLNVSGPALFRFMRAYAEINVTERKNVTWINFELYARGYSRDFESEPQNCWLSKENFGWVFLEKALLTNEKYTLYIRIELQPKFTRKNGIIQSFNATIQGVIRGSIIQTIVKP